MSIIRILTFILVAVTLFTCKQEEETISYGPPGVDGKWVELGSKTDTMTFGFFGHEKAFTLSRGREDRNGLLTPKIGSGVYRYEIVNNEKILLHWILSAERRVYPYAFEKTGDTLYIEKFYDNTILPPPLLTFGRLH